MQRGTLFLLLLLIVVLASSMVFGSYGEIEGAIGRMNRGAKPCSGPQCG
jgi:hypothetical protein